ncbi:MAG: transposase [Candidatus Woesearchaeota archaeon]
MALKYPNKIKRKGYWKAYEKSRINDYWVLWNEICNIIPKVQHELEGRGRKPKLQLFYLYRLNVFCSCTNLTLRELEGLMPWLVKKRLNHCNLSRWFSKLDEKIIDDSIAKLNGIMTNKTRVKYLADSSPFTLGFYRRIISSGKALFELVTRKLHAILAYLPALSLLCVVCVCAIHGDCHDSPPFRKVLLQKAILRNGERLHADKAYWAKDNINLLRTKGIKSNIVPRKDRCSRLILYRAVKEYDDKARKRNRGLIEGFFGGITTRQNMKCRYKNHQSKVIFVHSISLAQQIKTYMRYKIIRIINLISHQPSFSQK